MTVDADTPQEGIGLYRGVGETWLPEPAQERAPLADFDQGGPVPSIATQALSLQDAIDRIGVLVAASAPPDFVVSVVAGNTDASGNLYLPVYQIADGMEGAVRRLTVNAVNPATNTSYTAAAPYAAASAYMNLHGTDGFNSNDVMRGTLIDVSPLTAGGPLFPAVFEYDEHQAPREHGPKLFLLHVNGGPASTMVYCRYQVTIRRERGIV